MANETVMIGCRLPLGIDLEVHAQTAVPDSTHPGFMRVQVRKLEGYKRLHIRGTRSHHDKERAAKILVPSQANLPPCFTRVPKDFWEQWLKEHPNTWLVRSGHLFLAPADDASRKAATVDAVATSPAILQPIDPQATMKIEGSKVEVADFHKENVARSVENAAA